MSDKYWMAIDTFDGPRGGISERDGWRTDGTHEFIIDGQGSLRAVDEYGNTPSNAYFGPDVGARPKGYWRVRAFGARDKVNSTTQGTEYYDRIRPTIFDGQIEIAITPNHNRISISWDGALRHSRDLPANTYVASGGVLTTFPAAIDLAWEVDAEDRLNITFNGTVLGPIALSSNSNASFDYTGTRAGAAGLRVHLPEGFDPPHRLIADEFSSDAASTPTPTPTPPPPPPPPPTPVTATNSQAPSIAGSKVAGQTLTRTTGSWSNALSVAGQWLRAGIPIAGETGATYTTQAADVGQAITYRETATSSTNHTATATSPAIGPIVTDLKALTVTPSSWSFNDAAIGSYIGVIADTTVTGTAPPTSGELASYTPPEPVSRGSIVSGGPWDTGSVDNFVECSPIKPFLFSSHAHLVVRYVSSTQYVWLAHAFAEQLSLISRNGGNNVNLIGLGEDVMGDFNLAETDCIRLSDTPAGITLEIFRNGVRQFNFGPFTSSVPKSNNVGLFANSDNKEVGNLIHGSAMSPLLLIAADLTNDLNVEVSFSYTYQPGRVRVTVLAQDGAVIRAQSDLVITDNAVPGRAVGRLASPLPESLRGTGVTVRIAREDDPTITSSKLLYVPQPATIGYNWSPPNYYEPNLLLADWSKHSDFRDNTVYIPARTIAGTGTIETDPGITLTAVANENFAITSSNITTGVHTYSSSGNSANRDSRAIRYNAKPTKFKVTRDGWTGKFDETFEKPLTWVGVGRTMGLIYDEFQKSWISTPMLTLANRRKPTDLSTPYYPFEMVFDQIARLHELDPTKKTFAHNVGFGDDDYHRAEAAYAASVLASDVELILEFLNEIWNAGSFTAKLRCMLEGIKRGLYGDGAQPPITNIYVLPEAQEGDLGDNASPALTAGQHLFYTRGLSSTRPGAGGIVWRAKRNVAAGSHVEIGDDFDLVVGFHDAVTVVERYEAERHMEIIAIYKEAFGPSRAHQIKAVSCGQLDQPIDTFMTRLNWKGYLNALTHLGSSCYYYEPIGRILDPDWDVEKMGDSLRVDFEGRGKAWVRKWNAECAKLGKSPFFYEGGPHPHHDLGWPGTPQQRVEYIAKILAYHETQSCHDLERDFIEFMSNEAGGPFFYSNPYGNVWGLRRYYDSPVGPRYQGHLVGRGLDK